MFLDSTINEILLVELLFVRGHVLSFADEIPRGIWHVVIIRQVTVISNITVT